MANENLEEEKRPTTLSVAEQETYIHFMRDEPFATIYTSDSTQMTKLDKLCVDSKSSKYYSVIKETTVGKTYRCTDKSLVWGFRTAKKEMSEEQRKAAGERMKKYQENKKQPE